MNYKKIIRIISLILVICYSSISCEAEKKLSESDKIKILSSIFSDEKSPELFFQKCLFINMQITKPHNMFYNDINFEPYIEYVSKVLNVNDTKYIEKQIIENKSLRIKNLELYNFNFQEFENKKKDNNCFVLISKPIFNKEEDSFYIIIQDNGNQHQYLFKKEASKWIMTKKFGFSME